ncbi:MAG: ATP-dependent helicase [Alphaproteobacteria bacterium]|nr:ATP-dependent helicase [Alphaproteobacteria bacterium]
MDLSELNDAQRRAVTAGDGPHLVVAGAGTGKTRTLVHRVAWLIEQGVPPEGIVLLTFTRRAAGEMLDRVARLVGGRARGVRGGTFHSFANTALRRHADRLGYSPSFTILDRGDAEALVGMVRGELGLGSTEQRYPKRGTLLDVLSRATNTHRTIAQVLDDQYPQYAHLEPDLQRLAVRYAERKQEQGVMDFDDLLVMLARLLRDHEEARRRLSHAARHVLVDEYQDTNRLQASIAALLSSVHGNLMVVGDEAQSIYGFRGADVRNILDFGQLYPNCPVTVLEENYRSVQPILDLANGILETATTGYDKHLRSSLPSQELPVLADVMDEHAQAEVVVRRVLELREGGTSLDEQAILARASHHTHLLELALSEAGIPFRKYGGLRFSEAAHIKDVFALLRLVANPRDVLAWFRVLSWSKGLGAKTAQRIGDSVAAADDPQLHPAAYKGRGYHADLVDLAGFLEDAAPLVADVGALVDLTIAYYKERIVDIHEDWKKRLKDLDSVPLLAERFTSLDQFLAEVALDPVEAADADEAVDDEVLTVSTIHSAKGLEWDAVHLVQLGDGAFPSAFSLDDPDELEEERRLFYVAVTRARRHLMLVWPRFVRARRGPVMGPGCVLLDTIPHLHDLLETVKPTRRPWSEGPQAADADEIERIARLLDYFD